MKRSAAICISVIAAFVAILVTHQGLFIAPGLVGALLLAALLVPLLRPFRARALESGLLAGAAAFFFATLAACSYGYLPVVGPVPFGWIVWLPIAVASLVAEITAQMLGVRHSFATTAVAAAAFMIFPRWGNDVTTPYDSEWPSLAAASVVVVLAATRDRLPRWSVNAAPVVCPLAAVVMGWLVVLGQNGASSARDLIWLSRLIVAPASVIAFSAAALRAIRGDRTEQPGTAARPPS